MLKLFHWMMQKLDGPIETVLSKLSEIINRLRGFDVDTVEGMGATVDGYIFYMTTDRFREFLTMQTHSPEDMIEYKKAMHLTKVYEMNDLNPIIAYNSINGMIWVTSEEKLRGEFIQ